MSPPDSPPTRLVIVPCGRAKVWDKHPDAGPTAAADAYTGAPFMVNRNYAEKGGGDWVILSDKYGFLRPTDLVPGPYEVTFKRRNTNPIGFGALREQVTGLGLDQFRDVVGLGGMEYRAAVEGAFAVTTVVLNFPFSGLPIGKAMGATKRASRISSSTPSFHGSTCANATRWRFVSRARSSRCPRTPQSSNDMGLRSLRGKRPHRLLPLLHEMKVH